MEYDQILPLIRRDRFIPLRVHLKDGRSFDLRGYGQFALATNRLMVRLPYDLTPSTTKIETIQISLAEIDRVVELPMVGERVESTSVGKSRSSMTATELRARLTKTPFSPKRIIMNDGATYDVLMAKTFLVTKNWLELGQPDPELPPPAVRQIRSIPIAEIHDVVDVQTTSAVTS